MHILDIKRIAFILNSNPNGSEYDVFIQFTIVAFIAICWNKLLFEFSGLY